MNCHTMKTKIFIFFVLVSVFRLFADCESDKQYLLNATGQITYYTDLISDNATSLVGTGGYISNAQVVQPASRILDYSENVQLYASRLASYIYTIDCSNQTCSVDLGPLCEVVSNIYDVVLLQSSMVANCYTNLNYISELFEVGNVHTLIRPNEVDAWSVAVQDDELYGYIANLTNQVVSFNNDVSYSLGMVTNSINSLRSSFITFQDTFSSYNGTLFQWLDSIVMTLQTINDNFLFIYDYMDNMNNYIVQYLPYIKTISDDLKSMYSLLSTNSTFSIDQVYTNMFRYSNLLGFDRFRYYAQGQLKNTQVSLYPLSPYDTLQNLRNATIYDAVAAGFESLLISQGSINNYLYWLQAVAGSNRLAVVDSHIMAISNMVYRLDDYVLNDFSNEIANISYYLSFVTNQVDYTTNLVEITNQLHTNNNHLASIDSKLDVLGYIKVLSDTPLSQFSGDSYYDYLTNLYLTGGSSSSVSTNWFERIEILLASLVFGDSVSSNISTEVEFSNFSEDKVRDAFNDYTFQNELNSGIDLVENTGENFLTILRGFHNALVSVSQPQSIAIGIGGIDGGDTLTFDDAQHGHFQVSFGSGASDNFTLIVRSMTTIIWILFTMMFIYFSARWLLFKVLFFYRLMRTLITSLFLK